MSKHLRKHRLKLGIFLSYRSPEEGGGFTITNDILNSVLKSNQNHADLKLKNVESVVSDLDRVDAQTDSGVDFSIYEDGLFVLGVDPEDKLETMKKRFGILL